MIGPNFHCLLASKVHVNATQPSYLNTDRSQTEWAWPSHWEVWRTPTDTHRHPASVGLAAGQNQRRGDKEWRRTGDAKEQICSLTPHRRCPCLYWKHCRSDGFFHPCSLHKLPFIGLVKDQAVAAASQPIEKNNINYLHLGFDKEGWRHIYLQENFQSSLIHAICILLKNI